MRVIFIFFIITTIYTQESIDDTINFNNFNLYELIYNQDTSRVCSKMAPDTAIVYPGVVTSILSPAELIIKEDLVQIPGQQTNEENFFTVILSGICIENLLSNEYDQLKYFFDMLLDDEGVSIYVNDEVYDINSDTLHAELLYKKKSLNYSLLKNGYAEYREVVSGELDSWTVCKFKEAMRDAKKKNLGIWGRIKNKKMPN